MADEFLIDQWRLTDYQAFTALLGILISAVVSALLIKR